MGRKRIKQYLTLLMAVGVIAIVASGSGTFASFNAQVTNPNNTFVTGTLFLHQDPNGGTACYSEWQTTPGGSVTTNNSNGNCATLFNGLDLTTSVQKAYVTLVNAGSTDASNITAQVSNCQFTANDPTEPRFNTTLTCGDVKAAIQEVASASTSGTPVYCAYGTDNSGTCTLDGTHNLGNANPGELGTAPQTLMKDATNPADLQKLANAPANTRYYVLEIQPNLGSLSNNDLQNQKLKFDVSWAISQ